MKALQQRFADHEDIVRYLKNEWVGDGIGQHVVLAWTHKMLHFSNALTLRAEGIHAAIKKEIPHSFLYIRDIISFMKRYLLRYNANLKHKLARDRDQVHRLHRQEDVFAE